jgi:hypothetical protein
MHAFFFRKKCFCIDLPAVLVAGLFRDYLCYQFEVCMHWTLNPIPNPYPTPTITTTTTILPTTITTAHEQNRHWSAVKSMKLSGTGTGFGQSGGRVDGWARWSEAWYNYVPPVQS